MKKKPYRLHTPVLAVLVLSQFLFISDQGIFAQGTGTGRSWKLTADAGVGRMSVKDDYFSVLPHTGYTFNASASLLTGGDHGFHLVDLGYNGGSLDASSGSTSLKQTRLDASYAYFFRINEGASGLKLRPGVAVNSFYVRRRYQGFINNNEAFDFAASASVALNAAYSPAGYDNWSIDYRLYLPLISLVDQTAFGSESTSIGVDPSARSFSTFFRVISKLEVARQISEQHSLSIGYGWDFYHIKSLREVRQAAHIISLKYGFNF